MMIMVLKTVKEEIQDADFRYQNTPVKIVANRDSPEIKLVGLSTGPFEEGTYYEEKFWVAEELVRSGIANFQEGQLLDLHTLLKNQRRLKIHSHTEFQRLPKFFYPKARRLLAQLKEKAMKDPENSMQLRNAMNMIKDVKRARQGKINTMARIGAVTEQMLEKLTPEEKVLYQTIKNANDSFAKILE